MSKPVVLVLTHNFPRGPQDVSAPGFMPLFRRIHRRLPLEFVVPHGLTVDGDPLPLFEQVDDMRVHRFRYADDSDETLAYRGDMHRRVFRQPWVALKFYRAYKRQALRLARESQPSTLWAHWWLPGGLVGKYVARKSGLPLVVSCHGTDLALLEQRPTLRRFAAGVFAQARQVIVVSTYLKRLLLDLLGERVDGLERKIVVAPLPANLEAFTSDGAGERNPAYIVAATRYTTQKRHNVLIEAIEQLRAQGVFCRIDLFGLGPEKDALLGEIKRRHLENQITLNDAVTHDELADAYRRASISLLISEREGFGLSLVEAMLSGCAVIGARSGGITDIIRDDGRDGLLVELDDVDGLARALKSLLTDNDLCRRLANQGEQSARERFGEEVLVSRYAEVLNPQAPQPDR